MSGYITNGYGEIPKFIVSVSQFSFDKSEKKIKYWVISKDREGSCLFAVL
jgi:hypothetical protein